MKQSRFASLLETIGSTAFGFLITLAAQPFIYPLFGFHPDLKQNLGLVTIFTAISVARGYVWRRIGEALHIRHPLSAAALAIIAERRRQIEDEGYTLQHDDDHDFGELALAGAAYAEYTAATRSGHMQRHWNIHNDGLPECWPWTSEHWKPRDARSNLRRAGALILAEMERLDRNRKPSRTRNDNARVVPMRGSSV